MLCDPLAMRRQKRLGRGTRVITSAIVDQKQVLWGVRHDHLQEPLVTFRVESALDALIEQTPRKILNGPKHLVAFTLPTRGHLRLVPPSGPRVAERAPLGKTGFIFKKDQTFAPRGRPYNRRPRVLQPGQALGRVEMVRHKACLLKRKAQVVQQCRHIMTIVQHAKLAPDQHPDEDRVPTGGLKTHHEWPGLEQLDQAFLLPRSQLRSAATTMTIDQAVHTAQQQGLLPVIETRQAEAPALAQYRHRHLLHKQIEQDSDAPHQAHIIALIGVLKTLVEVVDGRTTELYSDAHGCILLWGGLASVLGEIYPCAHGSQP